DAPLAGDGFAQGCNGQRHEQLLGAPHRNASGGARLNLRDAQLRQFLHARLSTPALQLGEPGPDAPQLRALLEAAIRVPDHGKLVPWRLVLLHGPDRLVYGERLAQLHARVDPHVSPQKLSKERDRFEAAPLTIAVIARVEENHPKIPAQEQLLSAGCVAHNLLIGAQSLGYGAQWLTGWSAYSCE